MELPPHPKELLQGVTDDMERAACLGRWAVLQEMGMFGDKTNLRLARGRYPGTFTGAVRRHFSNTYGDVRGCDPADLEVAAELLGVFEDVYNVEAKYVAMDESDA